VTPLAKLLEAALFASARPVPVEELSALDPEASNADIAAALDEIRHHYDEEGHGVELTEIGGGWQILTRAEYTEAIERAQLAARPQRLSAAALETLAIIAYRQPISKPEIEAIRGVNSDQVLLSLLEKNLVAITGRSESVGRPLLYGTTDEFLRIFGLNSLNDLPKLREIEELMEDDAYSAEKIEVVSVAASSDAEAIEAAVGAAGHTDPPEDGTDENYADTAEDIDGPEDEVVLDDYERDEDTGDDDLLEEPAAVDLMLDEIDSEAEAMGAPGLTEDSATHVLDEIDALDQVDDVDGDSAE
jgi:segregation and condensation protein B